MFHDPELLFELFEQLDHPEDSEMALLVNNSGLCPFFDKKG